MLRVGQVLHRRRANVLMVLAGLSGALAAFGIMFALSYRVRENDPSSLGLMAVLPVHGFGVAYLHAQVAEALPQVRYWDAPVLWLFLAQPELGAFLFSRVVMLYRPSQVDAERAGSG
jgi:hypothetical protein